MRFKIGMDVFVQLARIIGDIFCISTFNTLIHVFFTRSKNRFFLFLTYFVYIVGTHGFLDRYGSPLLNICFNIGMLFILTLNYESKLRTKIASTFYIYAIMMIVDTIIICVVRVTGFSFTKQSDVSFFAMVTGVLSFFFALILRHITIQTNSYLPTGLTLTFCTIPVISIVFTFCVVINQSMSNELILVLSVFLFGINVIVFHLYDRLLINFQQVMDLKIVEEQNRYYEKQLNLMMESQMNLKRFRHDSKTRVLVLQSLLKNGDCEGALKTLQGMSENIDHRSEFVQTGNLAIDAVVNYHLQRAYDNGIRINKEIQIPSDLTIDAMDIGILLANLLENSISATIKYDIHGTITLKMIYDKGMFYVHVDNPYDGKVKCFGGKFLTTKDDPENHGLGLASVERIAKKYNGLVEIDHKGNEFKVDITMYLSNSTRMNSEYTEKYQVS